MAECLHKLIDVLFQMFLFHLHLLSGDVLLGDLLLGLLLLLLLLLLALLLLLFRLLAIRVSVSGQTCRVRLGFLPRWHGARHYSATAWSSVLGLSVEAGDRAGRSKRAVPSYIQHRRQV
jgi:hypothetical protein